MIANKFLIQRTFRYLWWALAAAVILFVLSQNIVTTRRLSYDLDFSESVSPDIRGWYPTQRTLVVNEGNKIQLVSEPVYMQVYLPAKFSTLKVQGELVLADDELVRLGLKQRDGSWNWQDITSTNFSLDYSLVGANKINNKIELILSLPNMTAESKVYLNNNWQIILSR